MHAHAAGERGIDVERLFRHAAARRLRHVMQGAHVVQTIGELDQQHAHVVGDREQELAQVLRLLRLLSHQIEFLQLGEALDQTADLRAEQAVDLRPRRFGVLDRVVQEGGRDGGVIELEIGEDRGDFDRVRKIRIARGAALIAVRLHRVDVGPVEQRFVGVRIVGPDALDQLVLPHHSRTADFGRLFDRGRFGRRKGRRPQSRLGRHARQIARQMRHRAEFGPRFRIRNRDSAPGLSLDITMFTCDRNPLPNG